MRIDALAWLDGNTAALILFFGILLIYWELCRPGMAVPGALGAAMAVIAAARLLRPGPPPAGFLAVLLVVLWVLITGVLAAGAVRGYLAKREFV